MRKFVHWLIARYIDNEVAQVKPESDEVKSFFDAKEGDPLDKTRPWPVEAPRKGAIVRTVNDFEVVAGGVAVRVGDSSLADHPTVKVAEVGDDGMGYQTVKVGPQNAYQVPQQLMDWYISQGFIGYQSCAILAQQWLVNKACTMAGEDAVRNGWTIKADSEDAELTKEQIDLIMKSDTNLHIKENLIELNRFKNIFGIRVAIFEVDSDDPMYYEKPFNIDGITPGSYRGISQVDPYWMTPQLTARSTSDPSSQFFYEPEYWIISGKKYHRSHLIIARGPQPADILKPTYIFGGMPLTQQIYERIYAAERTANEAPLLALNKRTTAIHVDMEKAIANERSFLNRLMMWVKYRDNHAVKVLGLEEEMEQHDTALNDFDSVIMNQYQLVAAIAKVPATKLLGTSPKGFNTTGEHEMKSYHQELESIQEHILMPMLVRHYEILARSLQLQVGVKAVFEPVDSLTAQELADLNLKKAQTGEVLVNGGALSADEERGRVRDDRKSGYTRLAPVDANVDPGMTPENLAKLQESAASETQGTAALTAAYARTVSAAAQGEKADETAQANAAAATAPGAAPGAGSPPGASAAPSAPVQPEKDSVATAQNAAPQQSQAMAELTQKLDLLITALMPEGKTVDDYKDYHQRSVNGSVDPSIAGTVTGGKGVVGKMDESEMPKMKLHGLVLPIENPRGSIRKGMGLDGKPWAIKMPHHYGYIRGTKGADGDEVDAFVGPNMQAQNVYVVNQKDANTGEFDEHKCMMGFDSADAAKKAYLSAYNSGWAGFDSMTQLDVASFKKWLQEGDTSLPIQQMQSGPVTQEGEMEVM